MWLYSSPLEALVAVIITGTDRTVISYININSLLTLLACTQSVENLFHTLMVLWENEYFLTSNLLCFFTSM